MTVIEQGHLMQLRAIVEYAESTLLQAKNFAESFGMPERAEFLDRLTRGCKAAYTGGPNSQDGPSLEGASSYVAAVLLEQTSPGAIDALLDAIDAADPPAHPEEPEPQKGETAVATEPGSVDEEATPNVRERWTRAVSKGGGRPAKRKRASRNSHSGVVNPGSSTI